MAPKRMSKAKAQAKAPVFTDSEQRAKALLEGAGVVGGCGELKTRGQFDAAVKSYGSLDKIFEIFAPPAPPKCLKRTRSGILCDNPKPCVIHELQPGKHWCPSMIDSCPHTRCQNQVDIHAPWCPAHKTYPDLSRKTAQYTIGVAMDRNSEKEEWGFKAFVEQEYGRYSDDVPPVHDWSKYQLTMAKKYMDE